MHRLIKYEGKDGENKLDYIASIHSLEGELRLPDYIGYPFYFEYNDASGKMMRSSDVGEILKVNGQVKITTRNSVFVFEEVEESDE